ncbi:hypothetical protein [Streptomyces sp. 6N223]|uniref:hypothetical protein n=1 Tax=Streptomyces sp. 6N223 TaxID=3457412 RepID=UPI003FD03645
MLALRLARGSAPGALVRRLLLAGAAAGVGFLLLAALGHALANPGSGGASALRLACCALPLAATLQLAGAVARADPSMRARSGLDAAGLGPVRVPVLAAASAALAGLLGSVLALLLFLHLRGDATGIAALGGGLPLRGAAAERLSAGEPLPVAAALTLLAVVPGAAAAVSALALRHRPAPPQAPLPAQPHQRRSEPEPAEPPVPAPGGLPWGMVLIMSGIALGAHTGSRDLSGEAGNTLALPGVLGEVTPGVVLGWLMIAVGIVLAAPGLTHLCGQVLAAGRPGVLRLLAGRALQREASRLGCPLGALCAASAALLAALRLEGPGLFGPLGVLGTVVVLASVLGTIAAVSAQVRAERGETRAALLRLGASQRLLRGVAGLRAGTALTVFGLLSWLAGELLLLPVA